MRSKTFWKTIFQIGAFTFIAAPLNVVLHELAHILALELGGIPADLVALGGAEPTGFDWTFEGLSEAQVHYGASSAAVIVGALAGPVFTLLVGYAGLLTVRRGHHLISWAIAYSGVAPRSVGNLLFLTPKVVDGSINSSDEAIAAFFLGWPVWSLWWLLVVGVICTVMLVAALPRQGRLPMAITGFICSVVGFLAVEYVVNTVVFDLESWDR